MMKNSKVRRILLLLACAVLLVSLSVGATLAYLTSTADVENTFTVGNVHIELDEVQLDENGDRTEDRTEEGNEDIHLLPGRRIDKDPTVTVQKGSEDCYVRVKVIVTVPGWAAAKDDTGTEGEPAGENFETWAQNFANNYILHNDSATQKSNPGFNKTNWEVGGPVIDTKAYTVTYILTYKNGTNNIFTKKTNDTALPAIFDNVYVPADLDNADLAKLAGMKIKVVAEAIQADGFTGESEAAAMAAAWDAFSVQHPVQPEE